MSFCRVRYTRTGYKAFFTFSLLDWQACRKGDENNMLAHYIRIFVCALFLVVLMPLTAYAKEEIHNYHVKIYVNTDGGLEVTETIDVRAEGKKVKRGIYRDFPLFRRTFLGGALPMKYDIRAVMRDGNIEPYHIKRDKENGTMRLYIGKSDTRLPKNKRYVYEIHYNVPAQVFSFSDYDELYWNAIGTQWNFPILKAEVDVFLPDHAPILDYSVYTGKVMSKGSDADYQVYQTARKFHAETTRKLAAHEGVTVALSFPKGYVSFPPEMVGFKFFLKQHFGLLNVFIGLLGMAAYYYVVWNKFGRDRKRRLAPFYDAPKKVSPAMASYIYDMGETDTGEIMTAAILSLAAKGYLEIEEKGKKRYKLMRVKQTNWPSDIQPMSPEEEIIFDRVKTSLTISSGSEVLVETADKVKELVHTTCHKHYFLNNTGLWVAGFLPLLLALMSLVATPGVEHINIEIAAFAMVFCLPGILGLVFAVSQLLKKQWFLGVFMIVWGAGFAGGGFTFLTIGTAVSWLVVVFIAAALVLFAMMRVPMKLYTRTGHEVVEHVAGLRYYMETVEEKVLQKFDPPQMSRELYEKYLPYAVALGVESKWADKFAAATLGAATAAAAHSMAMQPSWYSSTSGSSFSAGSMAGSMGSAIAGASSSNSSSGGGSSGGGGGGGGGGGW